MIEKYKHHGQIVSVQSHLIGTHTDHCLCFQGCVHFRPLKGDNCEIAQANYENCVKFGTVQPVYECPKFEFELKAKP
jgi:outer membrane lipoprotein SlyB